MSYKFITVRSRIGTLDEIRSDEFAEGVAKETKIAEAGPQLVEALRKTIFGLEVLAFELGRDTDKIWELASGLYDARAALAKAGVN